MKQGYTAWSTDQAGVITILTNVRKSIGLNFNEVLLDFLVFLYLFASDDRLCGPVVRVPGYRSRGLGRIPGATTCSEK
jgi:hypothetical protein